jgi:hypothetical protein
MSYGFAKLIKQAALEAMENGQPTDLRTGVVISTDPLKVQVSPLFILPESVLIVPRHLTDYTVNVSFNWETERAGAHSNHVGLVPDHSHGVQSDGDRTLTIHNKLKVNDKVALLRQKGGQFYYILDRID